MKVISGGQTGADQGGLVAARQLGIATGGWAPKGFRTEAGPCPELGSVYGLVEHESPLYPPRTAMNVADADATAWFGTIGSPGYRCTKRAAGDYEKPFRVITSVEALIAFIEEFNVGVLNVAGNRASKNPGIHRFTAEIVRDALSLLGKGDL